MRASILENGKLYIELDPANPELEVNLARIWCEKYWALHYQVPANSAAFTKAERFSEFDRELQKATAQYQGRIGKQKQQKQSDRRMQHTKLIAALIATEKLAATNSKSFSQIAKDATGLKNPTNAWKDWLLPGFERLASLTKKEGAQGVRDLLTQGSEADDLKVKKADKFIAALSDDEFLCLIGQAITKFSAWVKDQKADYSSERARLDDLLQKTRQIIR
jgi:hypothetical protein